MKLIRIAASGFPLFKQDFVMDFYASQRVDMAHKDFLTPLFPDSKYYINCAIGLIGVNASGKTSALKVVLLALDILNNEPINHSEARDILGNTDNAVLIINFISDCGELCQLETHISTSGKGDAHTYRITSETLWTKPIRAAITKKGLIDFSGITPVATRTNEEAFLQDDTSIIIAYNKKHRQHIPVESLLSFTNMNVLPASGEIPADVVQFLDPTVERLSFEKVGRKAMVRLKFKGGEDITLSGPEELDRYLSSGTIKGIVTFSMAIKTLREGGYLIIDELENHFNKEIAATLIRFFTDMTVNRGGGVLVFSTHYPEILDEFDRNDCVFITRNRSGLTVENLSEVLTRNDIKKSEAYQSGFLEGTVPAYDAYMRLKKNIQASFMAEG